MIEKLTELGTKRIVLYKSQFGEFKGNFVEGGKLERWERLMVAACKQSLGVRVPEMGGLIGWKDLLGFVGDWEGGGCYVMSCRDGCKSLIDCLGDGVGRNGRNVGLIVGPEGGFSENEEGELVVAGARRASLGRKRLRVETAAITATSLTSLIKDKSQIQ